jgi:hypothetical protein
VSPEDRLKLAQRLALYREDFPLFAAQCLSIRTKGGKTEPLALNTAQRLIHSRLEEQKDEKGWVRALILKGRQQGASTYVAGRFYHRTSLYGGTNTYILAHEQTASDNLFGIVDRYQRHNPVAPHIGTSNVKELVFDKLDSSYVVATAGQKAGGRSRSISLFHGSEVAFWSNAADHFASSVQAVPLLEGTEVILESTANGPGGEFYERWQDAEAGRGDYIAIFVPWFVSPEYSREPETGFELLSDAEEGAMSEAEYAEAFGLSLAQMAWRRAKIMELRSESLFRQEYPSTAAEAWVTAAHEPFIAPLHVLRARKRATEGYGPMILGVDPASMGGDRFSVAARRGPQVLWVKHRSKIDAQEGIAWVRSLIDEMDPARVNVDAGGIGHAIVTGLKHIGPKYVEKVRGVNFGGTAEQKLAKPKAPGPANRRAEMWQRLRDWLMDDLGPSIPDLDALQADMTAPKMKPRLSGDFLLESKDEMKRRGVRSPDLADAIALTFAQNEFITKFSEPKPVPKFGDVDSPANRSVEIWQDDTSQGSAYEWMG